MRRGFLPLAILATVGTIVAVSLLSRGNSSVEPAIGATTPSQTGTGPVAAPVTLFADEFEANELDASKWGTCHWWGASGCTVTGGNEKEWFLPEQVSTRGGLAYLTAERRSFTSPDGVVHPFVSGMISSGPADSEESPARFAFTYGRAEMRARLPPGKGMWSAFWLLPTTRESKPEIDVFEVLGKSPSTVRMHYHWAQDGATQVDGKNWNGPNLSDDWHTYAIDWTPGALVWLVDGVERWRVTGDHVPSEPMYLIASLAVGGDWGGDPDENTPLPSSLEIDYIRVTRP
jgi:beta-glucanase (GH16 family)